MSDLNLSRRGFVLALIVIAALLSSSCDSGGGMGVSVGYPARWGGGNTGPPVFAGGPSF